MRSPLRRTSAALILGAAIGLTCAAAPAAAAQTTGVIRGKVTDAATGRDRFNFSYITYNTKIHISTLK